MSEPVTRTSEPLHRGQIGYDVNDMFKRDHRYFVVDRDATLTDGQMLRVGIDKLDIMGGQNGIHFIRSSVSYIITVTNLTDQSSGDVIFCPDMITSYGVHPRVGVAPRGTVMIHIHGRRRVASGDVFIESIPESHPVQHVSRDDFKQLVQSVRARDAELTSEIEGLKVQNAKLVSEIEGLQSLVQEMQVKNVVTESMFVKKFDELCDVVEDVIDQNTSLRIQTQTTARRNPFDA